jgi:hypothetical protein
MSTVLMIGYVPDSLLKHGMMAYKDRYEKFGTKCIPADSLLKYGMMAYKERYKKFGISCIWKLQGNCALYCYILSAVNSDISYQRTAIVNAIFR